MSQPPSQLAFICKEGNKLDGASNFKVWKNKIDLVLIENEVMKFFEGNILVLDKNNAKGVAKYNEGEVRAQRIFFESIKEHLISFV